MKNVIEFIGDCLFAISLFVQYMLFEAYSFAAFILSRAWFIAIVLLLPFSAEAGGYCHTIYHDQVVTAAYPTTIIEHQNNEIFYSVGAGARDYAVSQQNVAAAEAGQVERQIASLQTQLASYRQQAQPVAAPAQLVYAVPVQAVATAAVCAPGQQPMATAQPMQPPMPPVAKATGIVEQRCAKCHSGPTPKGNFDITKKLTCNQATLAIKKVLEGKMPKEDSKFTDAETAQFSAEILGAVQPEKSEAEE